ncbi:hypothetical protein BU25DRAFT_335203, partial [Macroventuria anomochaeta]
PVTPTTPVTTDALSSLHNLIKQDTCGLDEIRRQRLERHHNSGSNARRSTRSVFLGKAKVMSYEDLQDARAKRAEKESYCG